MFQNELQQYYRIVCEVVSVQSRSRVKDKGHFKFTHSVDYYLLFNYLHSGYVIN